MPRILSEGSGTHAHNTLSAVISGYRLVSWYVRYTVSARILFDGVSGDFDHGY